MSDIGLNIIRKRRIDAERSDRDKIIGIDMLRGWLRGMHIDAIIGRAAVQDMPQEQIAELLGEHPRNHPREFTLKDIK